VYIDAVFPFIEYDSINGGDYTPTARLAEYMWLLTLRELTGVFNIQLRKNRGQNLQLLSKSSVGRRWGECLYQTFDSNLEILHSR